MAIRNTPTFQASCMVLELCSTEQTADQDIQQHLDRIRSLISTGEAESSDAEVELSESNFVELVESLLKDPSERETFYQDVFPVEFGPKYDTAIQMLILEFLSRLEKLLPIPDLEQTASLLNAVPSALEKCVQYVPDPIQLRTLLQYYRKRGHLDSIGLSFPLPALCLFIPALRLFSMWQVAQRGDIMDYGKLEEFVMCYRDCSRAAPFQTENPAHVGLTSKVGFRVVPHGADSRTSEPSGQDPRCKITSGGCRRES
uniref:TERF1-interacting nuclear factor 2 N-terminal domain-containing protein n=1 Tax=Hucho hucho TaxID=62062 RepID=A0A4W5L0S8_9TELE